VITEEPRKNRISAFDVCDTLYYSNTTHDFIEFVLSREPGSLKKLVYRMLNSRVLPFRYAFILINVKLKWDLLREFNISMLKGKSRAQLSDLARRFVDEILNSKRVAETQALLRQHVDSGLMVVLCSSSIEPVVSAISEELGIENYLSTDLQYKDELFTGKILNDITYCKAEILHRRYAPNQLAFAVSDNTSDLQLLSEADDAVAVVHSVRKEEFWRRHNFKIIRLSS